MSASIASPCLVFNRYFLSQMSCEAGCIGTRDPAASSVLTASRRTVLIVLLLSLFFVLWCLKLSWTRSYAPGRSGRPVRVCCRFDTDGADCGVGSHRDASDAAVDFE